MSIKDTIRNTLYNYFKENLLLDDIVIENPKDRKMGDYALPCFSYAKVLRKAPNMIAEEVKLYLEKELSFISKIEVVGGYVNVFLDKNIITKEDSKVIIIDYDQITNIQNNSPYYIKFMQNLLKIIFTKIEEKNDRIEILTEKTIRNKLLKYFQITSKRNGSKNIYLPFTLTELAEYIAVDRSAMSRELKNLKDDNIIEMNNKIIKIKTN